ncbi:hypothetical protein [Terrabacter sp. BE26]|uniref:DUF7455 domain-containing protein n=1 Tax=Terrabacter sp. BE26 TaxID=2898152 RepID=UPI0035BE983A
MSAATPPPALDTTPRQLTVADRCDRCDAQAWLKTIDRSGLDLLWCAHHGRTHLPAFPDKGLEVVVDEREYLSAALNPPPDAD